MTSRRTGAATDDTFKLLVQTVRDYSSYIREHAKHTPLSKQTINTVGTDIEGKKKTDKELKKLREAKKIDENKSKDEEKNLNKQY